MWKKHPQNACSYLAPLFFKTALSRPYGQKLKILIGNWAPAPSVIHTLWCTQLASEMMILHFFSSSHWRLFRVDEVIKYYYYHLPNFFISSQKRLWFLVFKDEKYLFRKVFDFLFSKMKTYYIFTKVTNVWSIKIRTTHNLSLWLYKYVWIILLYGHLVYFILKVLTWKFDILNEDLPKKVIIKSEKQFMHGSNFYGSDFMYWKTTVLLLNNGWFNFSRCIYSYWMARTM